MLTLKKLFQEKEKIKEIQIEFEKHKKNNDISNFLIGIFALNGIVTFLYFILTGKFLETSASAMFFYPIIMFIVELTVYLIFLVIKEKIKKNKPSKEKELSKLFFEKEKKELIEFVKKNYDYLEILKTDSGMNNKIFLSHFINLIKNSTREELIENNKEIRDYINKGFPYGYEDIKKKIIKIIEEKLNTKQEKEEELTEIDNVFKKETKKVIKSL